MFPLRLTSKACGSPIKRRSAEGGVGSGGGARVKSQRFLLCFLHGPLAVTSSTLPENFCNAQLLVGVVAVIDCRASAALIKWLKTTIKMDPIMLKTGHETPFPFHSIPSHPDSILVNVKRPVRYHVATICARFIFQVPLLPFAIKSMAHRIWWHLKQHN